MAAAKSWGLTPTGWEQLPRGDQAIILAYEDNERARCGSCGYPLDVDKSEIDQIGVDVTDCPGCRALHKHREKQRGKMKPWQLLSVIPVLKRRKEES